MTTVAISRNQNCPDTYQDRISCWSLRKISEARYILD
jgi:hypothetical protein